VLIADEVQGGIARTGKMFSIEHSGVVPDLITVAKGLGGGFPLSGVTGRATIMDAAHPGGLGGTYGGNPISIAAAHAVLDVIESEGCARARHASASDAHAARGAGKEVPCIGDVRGFGAMVAFELVKDPKTKEPDAADDRDRRRRPRSAGLILLSAARTECRAAARAADDSRCGARRGPEYSRRGGQGGLWPGVGARGGLTRAH
jgi:4-aminobutyrate aminotransferase